MAIKEILEDKEEIVIGRIDEWIKDKFPAGTAVLVLDDVYELAISLMEHLELPEEVHKHTFTKNTLGFYKRKRVISSPEGSTSKARYGIKHVLQAVIARLSGYLHSLTLEEAASKLTTLTPEELTSFLAKLVMQQRQVAMSRPGVKFPFKETDLSLKEVEALVDNQETPKDKLCAVAVNRFGLSHSAVAHSSRANLVERINTCVQNEKTNDVIARLASSPRPLHDVSRKLAERETLTFTIGDGVTVNIPLHHPSVGSVEKKAELLAGLQRLFDA